jgi:pimeloyl-ACP methyl ester carboxylesterase
MFVHGVGVDRQKASAAATQAALPHSDIVELPGQGHAAMDTAPQLFLDEVVRFFT